MSGNAGSFGVLSTEGRRHDSRDPAGTGLGRSRRGGSSATGGGGAPARTADLRSVRRVANRVAIDGFTVWEVVLAPGRAVIRHTHELAQIFIVCQGTIREITRRGEWLFRRGATVLRAPGTIEVVVEGSRHARTLVIDLNPPEYRRFVELFPAGMAAAAVQMSPVVVGGIPFLILEELAANDEASKIAMQGLLLQLLSVLGRSSQARGDRSIPSWLDRAVQLVESSYRQPLALHDIASAVGRHPTGVAREFRRAVGVSIGERIRDLRFRFATHELLATNTPLSEIASAAGYSDQAHFTREFRKRAGTSPADFRRTGGKTPDTSL